MHREELRDTVCKLPNLFLQNATLLHLLYKFVFFLVNVPAA